MCKKIEDNYLKLSSAIQESIERLSDSQMERSVHCNSIEQLDQKIQLLTAGQKELMDKLRQF
jgi:hypothetical protein